MFNIIFFKDGQKSCIDITQYYEPQDYIVKLELQEGQSNFVPRYKLEGDIIVDAYPEKTDEEVVEILQHEEQEDARKLEEDLL